jgi:hypothetical protein
MDLLLLATTSTGSWLVAKYLYNNKKNKNHKQHIEDNDNKEKEKKNKKNMEQKMA